MFLTVTLNPALDKTLIVPRNEPKATLRATRSINLAGGKGINVSRALLALGAATRVFMPLGGHPGAQTADLARAEGMEVVSVPVPGNTRMAITTLEEGTGEYWHYLEPGPVFGDAELEKLQVAFLDALEGVHTVCLCGSLPSPAAAPLLPWMVRAARERGLRVALDSFGPHQRPALETGPWLLKPNQEEWEATWGETLDSDARRWEALARMAGWGTEVAVLSLGSAGALALLQGHRYRVLPAPVKEVNAFGGGDSMVAGICWAAAQGLPLSECLAWGAACGAANAAVWDPGGISRAEVERLLPLVTVRPE
jgi:1-phosphofructokinase family hexose kinase